MQCIKAFWAEDLPQYPRAFGEYAKREAKARARVSIRYNSAMIKHTIDKRTVYVFGNPDVACDCAPYQYVSRLAVDFPSLQFVYVAPNADLPFVGERDVWIMDTVQGIPTPQVFSEQDIHTLALSPRTSVHDFDLGFQLKYLQKIGKLKHITIIGIPPDSRDDYCSIHAIFKKLVAQDMHGS